MTVAVRSWLRSKLGEPATARYRIARSVVRVLRATEAVARERTGRLATVQVGKYRMQVPNDMRWTFRNGAYYEQNVAAWLPRLLTLTSDGVFYDVGANAGYYTLLLASAGAEVHAFEPVSATNRILASNVARNQARATVHRLGLSDTSGRAEIRLFASSGNNSLFDVRPPNDLRSEGTESIELERLDAMVYEHGLPVPGLVKMDVEGAELYVLRGGHRLLREHRPTVVAEFNQELFTQAGYSAESLVAELTDAGYAIYWIPDDADDMRLHRWDESTDHVAAGNIVALDASRSVDRLSL